MLMIVSVCLPLLGAFDAPAELEQTPIRDQTPPSPCGGNDACRGTDAGMTEADAIDLTDDFEFTDGNYTNSYTGNHTADGTATGYCFDCDENNDMYIIDMEPGYVVSVDITWNMTGTSIYENYAYIVSMGWASDLTSYYQGSWGYDYYSDSGEIGMSSWDGNAYGDGIYGGAYESFPIDTAGETVGIYVWCYYCNYSYYGISILDYTMNITVAPGDGGLPGDETSALLGPNMPWASSANQNENYEVCGSPYGGIGGPSTSWSTCANDFDINGETVYVGYTTDTYGASENSVDVTCDWGYQESWSQGYFPASGSGAIGPFTGNGTCTVTFYDSWGDGGMLGTLNQGLGNFSGSLEANDFQYEDVTSGHVGQTDTSDVYVVVLPENFKANITLDWSNSADLDLYLYSSYDSSTESPEDLESYSWFDQPEFVEIGQTESATTLYVEVVYYGSGSGNDTSSGYTLWLQAEPGSPPPCFYQDDGSAVGEGVFNGNGEDATGGDYSPEDDALNVSDSMGEDGSGSFSGMLCAGYDDIDWFAIHVPAYHGLWAQLDFVDDEIDTNFNETTSVEADISFSQYMLSPTGGVYSVSSSYGFNPQAVATNESYYWNSLYLDVDSTVLLRLTVVDMTSDYENNYTVSFSTYNATEEPYESVYQNDAGQGVDAGDSYADALNLTTMNQTFTGYGHDSFDMYDYYRIYLPENYAMQIDVSFPGQNDIDLYLTYLHPTYGYYYFISSSYNNNPETVSADYTYSGNDLYLRIWTDRGSGPYEVSISMLTPGLAPGDNQDDCGMAGSVPNGDAADLVYPGTFEGHTFTNESTQADLNPYNEDGSVRESWDGGFCTAWEDETWDMYDLYSIAVPEDHYIQVDFDFDVGGDGVSSEYHSVYLLMCQEQHMACGFPANPAYFVEQAFGYGLDELTMISGLWPVGTMHNGSGCDSTFPNPVCAANNWTASNAVRDTPGWVYVYIYNFGVQDHEYTMNISFELLSELEGGTQNDANCACDAGPGAATSVHVNDFLNQSQIDLLAANNTLEFEGWNMANLDSTDRFTFTVPANHAAEITLSPGDDRPDVWMILDVYDQSWTQVGLYTYSDPINVNLSSTYASQFDTWLGIGVRNWGSYDDTGTNYTVTINFWSLDSDGDGWWDDLENACGTDPNDANDTPLDTDGDGICDWLDEDDDGDGIGDDLDELPLDDTGSSDLDGDGIDDADDEDIDGDGWDNIFELICVGSSTAETDNYTMPSDYDDDDKCDLNRALAYDEDTDTWSIISVSSNLEHALSGIYLDDDGDNDGTEICITVLCDEDAVTDPFDFDECADTDTDRDGFPDFILNSTDTMDCDPTPTGLTADDDDDDDSHLDTYEEDCGSDSLDAASIPMDSTIDMDLDDDGVDDNEDTDGGGGYSNGLCDALDPDDDNDGYNDTDDWAPFDSTEWLDSDGDLQGDNRDMDDDNDGWWDSCEAADWIAAQEIAVVENVNYFALYANGISNTCSNGADAFPYDSTEWIDTDGDGIGNNADTDDDGQNPTNPETVGSFSWSDQEEIDCGSDPLDYTSVPLDNDGDGECDATDLDDDGDGTPDESDAFPMDDLESVDTDGDLIGDATDLDDDGDGWLDLVEPNCGSDPMDGFSVPSDNDGDGECDLVDTDDDNDGTPDDSDEFPLNPTENADLDDDGEGDNADQDDDGDGWLDVTELVCANRGGQGDPRNPNEMPVDSDYNLGPDGQPGTGDETPEGDGLCDALDPDDDGDGFPDPANPNNPTGDEDRFPDNHLEWYDANNDGVGDNEAPVTLIDNIEAQPAPYVGILGAVGVLGYGLVQMSRNAAGSKLEDAATDYAEDIVDDYDDFDFEDEQED